MASAVAEDPIPPITRNQLVVTAGDPDRDLAGGPRL